MAAPPPWLQAGPVLVAMRKLGQGSTVTPLDTTQDEDDEDDEENLELWAAGREAMSARQAMKATGRCDGRSGGNSSVGSGGGE